jgi:hypothetical protein
MQRRTLRLQSARTLLLFAVCLVLACRDRISTQFVDASGSVTAPASASASVPAPSPWTVIRRDKKRPEGAVITSRADGRIYSIGGMEYPRSGPIGGVQVDLAFEYATPTAQPRALAPVPPGLRPTHAAPLPDGRLLVVGVGSGPETPKAFTLDPDANRWQPIDPPPTAHPVLTVLRDGRVLLTGGQTPRGASSACALFDARQSRFSAIAPMAGRRYSHIAVQLADGRVLAAGGSTGEDVLTTAELYDPKANRWSKAAEMSTYREFHGAVLLDDGQVLEHQNRNTLEAFDVARYDPKANAWAQVNVPSGLGVAHVWFDEMAKLADGRVLFIGLRGNRSRGVLFDPSAGRWSPVEEDLPMMVRAEAVPLADGRVLWMGRGTDVDVMVDPARLR